jgi:hypothetical protein
MVEQEFFIQEQLEDFESLFHTIPVERKVILNNYDYLNKDHRDMIPQLIKNTIKDDIVNLTPTCQCKATQDFSNLGATCPACETKVTDMFADFSPFLWVRAMEGMPMFISPMFLLELDRVVNIQVVGDATFSMVRWFSDKQYNPDVKTSSRQLLDIFTKDENMERSYTWFANNIEYVIVKITRYTTAATKVSKLKLLLDIYKKRRNIIHVSVIPFPHKKFMIHEPNALGNYIQGSIPYLMNSALLFMKYKDDASVMLKERATGRMLSFLTKAYLNIIDTFLAKKEGGFRKNLFGLRGDYNMRAVIVPIQGQHKYDELYIPWKSAIRIFEYHIRNIMYNRMGMTMNVISKMLSEAECKFDKTIYGVLETLIKEARDGVACILYRNPSQNNASIVRLRITHVTKDVGNETFALSPLTMPVMNADVDGDQCNVQLPLDNYMIDLLEPFAPHNTVSSVAPNPLSVFGKVGVPDTVAMTMTNLIMEEKKNGDNQSS